MKNIFHLNTDISYNVRLCSDLYCRNPKKVKYRKETTPYLEPKIWPLVPKALKSSKSLDTFKYKIRQ